MIATLAMYDRVELRDANDRYWRKIQTSLGYGPQSLSRTGNLFAQWFHQDLVLGQTCGFPLRHILKDSVKYVGTPNYGIEDCPEGYYNSVIISHKDQGLEAAISGTFAYNDPFSQSGWAAPMRYFEEFGYVPRHFLKTGSHAASARAVFEKRADIAAIDALTLRLLHRYDPWSDELFVPAKTPATPGLPYICAPQFDAPQTALACEEAINTLPAEIRGQLSIKSIEYIPIERYFDVPDTMVCLPNEQDTGTTP